MAKRKKATKKKRPAARPAARRKAVTVSVTTKTKRATIGKATRGAAYYVKQAKDRLYSELGNLFVKKEKATKKNAKKKIQRRITDTKRRINKLK